MNPFSGGFRCFILEPVESVLKLDLALNVDDILCISHDTAAIMDELDARYGLKDGSVGLPERYLGANTKFTQASFGLEC